VKEEESAEAKERLKETDANKSSGDEEPPLNSDDDGEDENAETIFETDNVYFLFIYFLLKNEFKNIFLDCPLSI